ncbi:MAG: hypothetical protein KUG67_03375 [Proteobacteria bacterium]|nr:hypothetical protein [Pseudomonadota bacterium]
MNRSGSDDDGSTPGLSELIMEIADRIRAIRKNGGSAVRVLAGMFDEDPLGLWDRSASLLMRDAYLLDPAAVTKRAMALVVYRSTRYCSTESSEEWLNSRLRESIASSIDEEAQAYSLDPVDVPEDFSMEPRFWFVTRTLGLSPVDAWRGCIRFNTLGCQGRSVFLQTTWGRRQLLDVATERGLSLEVASQLVRQTALSLGVDSQRVRALLDLGDYGGRS